MSQRYPADGEHGYILRTVKIYTDVKVTKTLIDIDDALLEEAMLVIGSSTKKDTVNEALAQVVRRGAAVGYVDLLRTGIVIELDDPAVTDDAQR